VKTKTYAIPPKNLRAVNLLQGWFSAIGISVRPGQRTDLEVANANGGYDGVVVSMEGASAPAGCHYSIDARVITGRRVDHAMEAFRGLCERLGWKNLPPPVDRGKIPQKRVAAKDDFDLRVLRHRDFHRVPNPAPHRLESYKKMMEYELVTFVYRNQDLCRNIGFDVDDLRTYAQVWVSIFIGRDEIKAEEGRDTHAENQKKARSYVRQRLFEMSELIRRKRDQAIQTVSAEWYSVTGAHESIHDEWTYVPGSRGTLTRQPASENKLLYRWDEMTTDEKTHKLKAVIAEKGFSRTARCKARTLLRQLSKTVKNEVAGDSGGI